MVEQEARTPALGRGGCHAHARVVLHARLQRQLQPLRVQALPAQSDAATEPRGSDVPRTTGRLLINHSLLSSAAVHAGALSLARTGTRSPRQARPAAQSSRAGHTRRPAVAAEASSPRNERNEEAGAPAPWRCTASARCAAAQARPRRAVSQAPWSPSRCPWRAPPPPRPWARLPLPDGAPHVSTASLTETSAMRNEACRHALQPSAAFAKHQMPPATPSGRAKRRPGPHASARRRRWTARRTPGRSCSPSARAPHQSARNSAPSGAPCGVPGAPAPHVLSGAATLPRPAPAP